MSAVSVLSLPIAICHHFLVSSFLASSLVLFTACEVSEAVFKFFVLAAELFFESSFSAVSVLFLPIVICHHFLVSSFLCSSLALSVTCPASEVFTFFAPTADSIFGSSLTAVLSAGMNTLMVSFVPSEFWSTYTDSNPSVLLPSESFITSDLL